MSADYRYYGFTSHTRTPCDTPTRHTYVLTSSLTVLKRIGADLSFSSRAKNELPPVPLEVDSSKYNWGSGERHKLPSEVPGDAPADKRSGAY